MQEKADQSSVNAMTSVEVYLLINFIIKKLNKKKGCTTNKEKISSKKTEAKEETNQFISHQI